MQNNTKPTYKRIILLTKDGWRVYGDTYRVVGGSPVLYPDYIKDMQQQDFDELEKALAKHELTLSDIDRWFVEVVENGKEDRYFMYGMANVCEYNRITGYRPTLNDCSKCYDWCCLEICGSQELCEDCERCPGKE